MNIDDEIKQNEGLIGKVIKDIKTSPHPFDNKNIVLTSTASVGTYTLNVYDDANSEARSTRHLSDL